jgi:hypothetical protein
MSHSFNTVVMMLSEYASLEFIIDDSGSMQMDSDTINPVTKRANTRWEEAHQRLKEMVEILAYVPFNQIGVEFLNRKDRISLKRNGMAPRAFLAGAYDQIDAVFAGKPSGTTPALEKLQESFLRGHGVSIARYIFGDGLPNGGQMAIKEIVSIIKNRVDPESNPVTFLSCTNDGKFCIVFISVYVCACVCFVLMCFLFDYRSIILNRNKLITIMLLSLFFSYNYVCRHYVYNEIL